MRLAAAMSLLLVAAAARAEAPYGILLLAHGGNASWNTEVERLRAKVNAKVPAETALGMADVESLQAAVDRLEKRKVKRIVAVPLFVHSRSEVLDQTAYALGLREQPSEVLREAYERIAQEHAARAKKSAGHGHAAKGHGHSMEFSTARVKSREPIALAPALDDHALVGRILSERAKALSKDPARERVVLVAHGPVDDAAVEAWHGSLRSLCGALKDYRGCGFGLLRDDAAPEIRAAAVLELRALVAGPKGEQSRALVIPVLIARGGIERKIVKDLSGLKYAWDGKTLMPHDGFDAWVLERAASATDSLTGPDAN